MTYCIDTSLSGMWQYTWLLYLEQKQASLPVSSTRSLGTRL